MAYDFDTVVDRRGTGSVKWDYEMQYTGTTGLLPLWVADMDFPAPPEIMQAIRRRVDHPVFGYAREPDSYFEAAAAWFAARHAWSVRREWMVTSPGVLAALAAALLAFTKPGDGVVIQPPVYYPFALKVKGNGRRVVENPLVLRDGTWQMDLDGLEKVIDEGTRMLVLCSPHNPVGRVWEPETLRRLADICAARDVLIVSDEIHNDLVLPGHRHTPIGAVSAASAANTVTLVSATKTFNMAGLGGSLSIIANDARRKVFEAQQWALFTGIGNTVAIAAAEAAWRHGAPWLDQLLFYIKDNDTLLKDFLAERLPAVRSFPLEGTYLALLDMRGLGLADAVLKDRLLRDAKVWLDEGVKFGVGGERMQRLNLACPRSMLAEALERMARAFSSASRPAAG